MTLFSEFVSTCIRIESISGSLEMTDAVSQFLTVLDPEEIPPVCCMLMGSIFPAWMEKDLGIGPNMFHAAVSNVSGKSDADIRDLLREAGDIGEATSRALGSGRRKQATLFGFGSKDDDAGAGDVLTILGVYGSLSRIADTAGKESQARKIKILETLLSEASPADAKYIARIVLQELRIGVGEGIVRDAVSKAFSIPVDVVEFAFMVTNDMGLVAQSAKTGGEEAVRAADIRMGRPVKMMLAQVTPSVENALSELGRAAVEWKFDGARLQIHKDGATVRLYSRRLENVTSSLPDMVEAVRRCVKADAAILDGEAVAVDADGRPRAFQDILRRFRRKYNVESVAEDIPLHLNLFDLLYLNGKSLIKSPLEERRRLLSENVADGPSVTVGQFIITDAPADAYRIYEAALAAGHEGIMIKNPASPYTPGKRGKNWMKKKPIMDTLDLVVVGGEWGVGKRKNKIGSFTVACASGSRLVDISRVGTGLSDDLLDALTKSVEDLVTATDGTTVTIRPKVVFEVAFEEIQKSPNTQAGYALRFPRLVQVREDKSVEDIDTMEKIEKMYEAQAGGRKDSSVLFSGGGS